MLRIKNRTICKRICRKERGAASVQPVYCSPQKILLSPMGNSAKKTFTGEILCQLKETGIPLALDAKKNASEY